MKINLPSPSFLSSQTLEQTIEQRRSCREFLDSPLAIHQLAQLLWSAQGITGLKDERSAPSAGAQYPLQVYVVSGNIEDVPVGLYQYQPLNQELHLVEKGDLRNALYEAALGLQPWVREAAIIVVLAADFSAMKEHFKEQPPQGERGDRYIFLESGAVAQNLHLQATGMELGAVLVGGFDDEKVKESLNLSQGLNPVALICIGKKK